MSDDEIELWDAMLCSAITSAGSANVRPTAVVEHIAERLGSKKVKWCATLCWNTRLPVNKRI
jgi:hypothetical protein